MPRGHFRKHVRSSGFKYTQNEICMNPPQITVCVVISHMCNELAHDGIHVSSYAKVGPEIQGLLSKELCFFSLSLHTTAPTMV